MTPSERYKQKQRAREAARRAGKAPALTGAALEAVRATLRDSDVPARTHERIEREVARRLAERRGLLHEAGQAVVMLRAVLAEIRSNAKASANDDEAQARCRVDARERERAEALRRGRPVPPPLTLEDALSQVRAPLAIRLPRAGSVIVGGRKHRG